MDSKLRVAGLKDRIRAARLLATAQTLTTSTDGDDTVISLSESAVDPTDTVVALELTP
jgi:hypothetical protein